MIDNVQKEIDSFYGKGARELARVQAEAQKQSFERNGFTQYTFIVNGGCCPICQALSGKHFKVKDMMTGENAPPMHPYCRCSTAAYEDLKEYEAWLDYPDKGGSTKKWNEQKAEKKSSRTRNKVKSRRESVANKENSDKIKEKKYSRNVHYRTANMSADEYARANEMWKSSLLRSQ